MTQAPLAQAMAPLVTDQVWKRGQALIFRWPFRFGPVARTLMKTIPSLVPASFLCMACFTAQATDCSSLPAQDHSEAAVLKLDEEWSRAYSTGDQAFLECLYATGFASANANGALRGRAEDIAGARKNIGKSWSPDGQKFGKTVQLFPHAAVVTMVRKDGDHSTRISDIYEYDGRRWQVMFTQDTKF